MKNNKSLNSFLINFLSENIEKYKLSSHTLFFCRYDGVPIFFHNSTSSNANESTIGALLGGAWQAAESLSSFIPNAKNSKEFRFSFDNSSQGIYAVPISLENSDYFLGIIYTDQLSPGKIKSKLRTLLNKLESEYKICCHDAPNTKHSDNKSEYLFKDISDSEMDTLFSFTGN